MNQQRVWNYQCWEGKRHLLAQYPILKKQMPLDLPVLVNLVHLPVPELFMCQKVMIMSYMRRGEGEYQQMWSTKYHSRRFVANGWKGYFSLFQSMM